MPGKPAARITDMHTCPQTTALVPHVGGPVITGSPDVFINGRPAARMNDNATCCGPQDKISEGSASVFINNKPAARIGDRTVHGGIIISGSGDVFIGDYGGGGDPCPRQALTYSTPFYDPS